MKPYFCKWLRPVGFLLCDGVGRRLGLGEASGMTHAATMEETAEAAGMAGAVRRGEQHLSIPSFRLTLQPYGDGIPPLDGTPSAIVILGLVCWAKTAGLPVEGSRQKRKRNRENA